MGGIEGWEVKEEKTKSDREPKDGGRGVGWGYSVLNIVPSQLTISVEIHSFERSLFSRQLSMSMASPENSVNKLS